jgi:hypothetical protein
MGAVVNCADLLRLPVRERRLGREASPCIDGAYDTHAQSLSLALQILASRRKSYALCCWRLGCSVAVAVHTPPALSFGIITSNS